MNFLFFVLGVTTILGIAYLLSNNRKAIKPRPIIWGICLQILFGILVIYWPTGSAALQAVSDAVTRFLGFAMEGSKFVFGSLGDPKGTHQLGFLFAFLALPTIIFFSAFMSILYHYGVMQRIVAAMAWLMAKTMGTSGSESLVSAANVFVGQTEAPLLVRPFIPTMTASELNAVMVAGFGTIAGGVMGAYISMGVDAKYIITASLMAAPGSLMIAKILFPETEESATARSVKVPLEISTKNGIEAASKGAADGLYLALNVGAMLIAFIALIKLLDACLGWLDYTVDNQLYGWLGWAVTQDPLSKEYMGIIPGSLKTVFSTLLWPLAWLMGVPYKDCSNFAYLVGMKISLNEFVAYGELARLTSDGLLGKQAIVMATFALCGFANFASIGIQIGGITPMVAPDKQDALRSRLSSLGVRAMFGGALVSLLTATIAGLLYSLL
jgi:CNT family concentrative nucleoside transporter